MTPCAKAFKVCFFAFLPAIIIACVAFITNIFVPDNIFDNPAYSGNYTGVKEVITFIKTIDTADYYATLGTAIASGITLILAKMGF